MPLGKGTMSHEPNQILRRAPDYPEDFPLFSTDLENLTRKELYTLCKTFNKKKGFFDFKLTEPPSVYSHTVVPNTVVAHDPCVSEQTFNNIVTQSHREENTTHDYLITRLLALKESVASGAPLDDVIPAPLLGAAAINVHDYFVNTPNNAVNPAALERLEELERGGDDLTLLDGTLLDGSMNDGIYVVLLNLVHAFNNRGANPGAVAGPCREFQRPLKILIYGDALGGTGGWVPVVGAAAGHVANEAAIDRVINWVVRHLPCGGTTSGPNT
eukprot:gene23212-176_t